MRRRVSLLRAVLVLVVASHPVHGERKTVFITTLRRKVEVVIRSDQRIQSTRVGRIRVKDGVILVLVEHASAGGFALILRGAHLVVVVGLAFRQIVLRE